MLEHYFQHGAVRPEFKEEYISLWPGWLGPGRSHLLDEVTEPQWQRFNDLLVLVARRHEVFVVDPESEKLISVDRPDKLRQAYQAAMEKDSSHFTRLVIPELECILSEEWDFTYILWHKDRAAVDALAPLVEEAGLFHFGSNAA